MKERAILFSAPMVRALLAGTKTQTRRAVKPQPSEHHWQHLPGYELKHTLADLANGAHGVRFHHTIPQNREWDSDPWVTCPFYGQPGDRLWVRENGWERPERTPKMMREGADTWAPYYYDADGLTDSEAADFKAWGFKRRPSIHMPRAACRIVLEVTGVRVERLRTISAADCIAEGCPGGHGAIAGYQYNATPGEHYMHVWTSLNGAESWAANPWVWVVEFRRA